MNPKSYRPIFASDTFTGSPSGFSKDNLGLHVGESVCNKYQTFTAYPVAVAMVHGENRGLWVYRHVETVIRTHWALISFSLKVSF